MDHYLKLLKSPHLYDRSHAAFHLADRGQWAAAAVPDLVGMLDDGDTNKIITGVGPTRREATRALAAIGQPALDAVLARLAAKKGADWPSLQVLAKIGGPRATEVLVSQLSSADPSVRRQVLDALGGVPPKAMVTSLIARLTDEDASIRAHAAEALGRVGDARAVGPLVARLVVEDENALMTSSGWNTVVAVGQALLGLGPAAVEPLLAAARRGDTRLRARATTLLGLINDPRAQDYTLTALDDPEPTVRAAALRALAAPSDASGPEMWLLVRRAEPGVGRRALPGLLRALEDGDEYCRGAAAAALGHLGTRETVSALLAALTDRSRQVRQQVLLALAETDDPRAREAVVAAFSSPDLQQSALWAVQRYRCGYATRSLIAIVADTSRDEGQRATAADALRDIADPSAVPALSEALRTGGDRLRSSAAVALGTVGDQAARDVLLSYVKESDPKLEALGFSGLSRTREPRAFDALLAALSSDQWHFRCYAAQGLARLRDRRATRPLLEAFKRSAGTEGQQVRQAILEALGEIGDRSAVPSLIWVLGHYHAAYRPQAAAALKQITGRDLGENPLVWQAWWRQQGGK